MKMKNSIQIWLRGIVGKLFEYERQGVDVQINFECINLHNCA